MVDFEKLRASKSKTAPINPIEIFRRLPHPAGFFDLAASQEEVLNAWFERRGDQDLVIKLHTGGGKTLIGLLIAQSILNETHEPVVYLCPNNQLVNQTLAKAAEYSIDALAYERGSGVDFQSEFLAAKSVLVCTYKALFNGKSRFGSPGSTREIQKLGGLILDDAHVAFSEVRDAYTLRIERGKDADSYLTLADMFREDFRQLGKLGTFDDIVQARDYNILEVPYWSWRTRSNQVHEYLKSRPGYTDGFTWPFLRDAFDYCHALLSRDSFVITPLYPLIDLIPTFAQCPRRIFMSATIKDDSEIIRTFDARKESIAKPIVSNSLAGISERMILAPALMQFEITTVPQILVETVEWAKTQHIATVILVPSDFAAQKWNTLATYADSPEKVDQFVKELQEGTSQGPFVFANRYDGIDLPGNACRLLILDGMPRGASEYELHRNNTFLGGATLNSSLAQRLEQGMGRSSRGPSDFSVVILAGRDLISWIGRPANVNFLTSGTRAQLQMGIDISKNVGNEKGFFELILSSLNRAKDWIKYHAETLAESVSPDELDSNALECAAVERKAFRLWRDGYFEKAISKLNEYCETATGLDPLTKGWLLQYAARIAYYSNNNEASQAFQQAAYAHNHGLLRPQAIPPYVHLVKAGKQAELIAREIDSFSPRRGFLSEFEEVVSHLTPQSSANQFEESLKLLGSLLGFSAERPENAYSNGPDVLWVLDESAAWVIEAKSRKKAKNAFTKVQHGQLLIAMQWFQKEYAGFLGIPVSVQANSLATPNAVADNARVLTYEKLNELIADARDLFTKLVVMVVPVNELAAQCEKLLASTKLQPKDLTEYYLLPFTVEKKN